MFDPERHMRLYQENIMKEVEKERLVRQAMAHRKKDPSLLERLFSLISNARIANQTSTREETQPCEKRPFEQLQAGEK